MMTPQEVGSHAFTKAALGGYNMAMVDEFLDLLTEDYATLYNDNAILKNKLKVLSDTVEEYRATDDAMRKTLLAAQQMAETMVRDAEEKKASLLRDAQAAAQKRIDELKADIAAEEYRLKTAQEATAAYVAKVSKLYQAQDLLLQELNRLVPEAAPAADPVEETAQAIENNLEQILTGEAPEGEPEEPSEPAPAAVSAATRRDSAPMEATRRFDDLQFGRDYEIR